MAVIWFCLLLVSVAFAAPNSNGGFKQNIDEDFFPQFSPEKHPSSGENQQIGGEKQQFGEIPDEKQQFGGYPPAEKQQFGGYPPAEKQQTNFGEMHPSGENNYQFGDHPYPGDKHQSNYERPHYQYEHEAPEKPSWYQPAYQRPQYKPVEDKTPKLKKAEPCRREKCLSPDCRCSEVFLSRDIDEEHIPQLVMLTFDDAVTALNYNYIKESMSNLRNPDGCPVQATFFVSHEYTDYTKVHLLWSQGHEIALHSITHSPYTKYWRNADVETMVKEFGGQRHMMAHFANMNIEDITGMRVPLFEMAGNSSFLAMKQIGLTYDSSWPTQHFVSPGLWPYSLEYASVQDCPIGSCPTASIPNIWVNPILNWEDEEGHKCSMVDACPYAPEDDVEVLLKWMITNFNRTYHSNRAPFGTYLHASWFLKGDNHFEAYKRFLLYLNSIPDVYMVSNARVLEYVRNPKIGKPFDTCQELHEPLCKERFCRLMKTDTKVERWMKSCMPCPAVYPWIGNPFGKAERNENKKETNNKRN